MGDEAFSGQTSTEADVKITHTRKQDVAWFYSTIFLVPAFVIGAGVVVTRSARRKRRQSKGGDKRGGAPKPERRHLQRPRREVRRDRARAGCSRWHWPRSAS